MRSARKLGTLKQYIVGRGSEATFADAFEKQEAIIRYLGGFDPTGEVGFLLLHLCILLFPCSQVLLLIGSKYTVVLCIIFYLFCINLMIFLGSFGLGKNSKNKRSQYFIVDSANCTSARFSKIEKLERERVVLFLLFVKIYISLYVYISDLLPAFSCLIFTKLVNLTCFNEMQPRSYKNQSCYVHVNLLMELPTHPHLL